jgi:DNA mismatch endonuclease (patch repair protein)
MATDPRNPAPSSLATRTVMRANRGRDTSPELTLRGQLWRAGMRGYRTNLRVAGVRPDVVFSRQNLAVFVHGCFWHRCAECALPLPQANRAFWAAKFRRNRQRDRQKRRLLEAEGWSVLEFWAHEIEGVGGANRAAKTIARSLRRPREGVRR